MRVQEESHTCDICGMEHVHRVEVYSFDTNEFESDTTYTQGPVEVQVNEYYDLVVIPDDGYTLVDYNWDRDAEILTARVVEHNPPSIQMEPDDYDRDDSFEVIVMGDVWDVEYDVEQAQNEGMATFDVVGSRRDVPYVVELELGDNITIEIANEIIDEHNYVYGFIVPDHLLGTFIDHFPDHNVYPERGDR